MRPRTPTGSATGSQPNTRTVPVSALSKPRMCLMSVVFPAPFSPTSPKTHPFGTYNDTPSKAVLAPNRRDNSVMATTASADDGDGNFIWDFECECFRDVRAVRQSPRPGQYRDDRLRPEGRLRAAPAV